MQLIKMSESEPSNKYKDHDLKLRGLLTFFATLPNRVCSDRVSVNNFIHFLMLTIKIGESRFGCVH